MASIIVENGEAPRTYGIEYGDDTVPVSFGPLIRHGLAVARRNIWLILSIVTLFVVAAVLITLMQTPKYTAHANIEISSQTEQVLGDKFETSSPEVDAYDMDRFLNTQISILQSKALAERVAKRLSLFDNKNFIAAMQIDESEFTSEADRREQILFALMSRFEVTMPTETQIAELEFTSTDPQLSAQIVNAFAEEFIQSNLQRKFDSSSYARNFVSDQLGEARARLEASEQQLNAYARQAGLIRARDPSTSEGNVSTSITSSSLMQLNQSANDAKAKLADAEARWNAERAQPLLSSPAALASTTVQQLLERRNQLQAARDAALERYLPDHPSVQRFNNELQITENLLNRAASQARDSVRAEYNAARTAERELRSQVDQLEGATMREQDRSVRYNTLAREADTNRSIYEGLLQRYRELNASAGITASNVAIIDRADPPSNPSAPRPLLNVAVALLFGFVFAGGFVLFREQIDDRIRIPEEVEQKVGLNLLGVIPATKDSDPMQEMDDPKSVLSESYSALRSTLLYSTPKGLPGVMLVTSAQASEGKSTTSYAIARGMALIGKRTLLLDADLRRPSVHRLIDIPNVSGVSNVLVGEKTIGEVVVPGPVEKLSVLTSGPIPVSPAELLSSPRIYAMLEELRRSYDFIVIDSAPVLGLADSPGLAALVDGVLLVVEADRGRGGQLKAAVRRLRQMKPNLLGALLTKFNPDAAGNEYSTYYNYDYYQYGSSNKEK